MPKKTIARPTLYTLEILGRHIRVANAEEASKVVSAIRDESGAGASEMGSSFPVRENGVLIGYVSYNGKVWKGDPADSENAELVYDPYAASAHESDIPEAPARLLQVPRGSLASVAKAYAEMLWKNTDDFMERLVSYEEFGRRQTEIWSMIKAAGEEVDDKVLELLRSRPRLA